MSDRGVVEGTAAGAKERAEIVLSTPTSRDADPLVKMWAVDTYRLARDVLALVADREALQRERDELQSTVEMIYRNPDLAGRVGVLEAALRDALSFINAKDFPRAAERVRAVLAGGEAGGQGQQPENLGGSTAARSGGDS